ncbi:MAG: fibronectin type III domain-containing protein [Thermoleophilia bacterium]
MRLASTISLALAAMVGILGGAYFAVSGRTPQSSAAPAAAFSEPAAEASAPGVRDAAARYGPLAAAPGIFPLVTASPQASFESVRTPAGSFASALVPFSLGDPSATDSGTPGLWTPLGEPTSTPPTGSTDAAPAPPLTISDVQAVSLSAFAATVSWRTSEPVGSRVSYGVDVPTLWTATAPPSVDHVATLTGLTFDTAYRVSIDARADDGRRVSAPFLLNTPGLTGAERTVADGDVIRVDGQPFFPTIVWNACTEAYPTNLAAGIELFMGNGCGSARDQLAQLEGRALSVSAARGPAASGPGHAGTFLPDEWDLNLPGSLSSAEAANLASTFSAGPRWLTLSNHFYSQASPLPQGRALYPALVANAEVLGFDLYPLQSWCRFDSFGDVFASQQELVGLAAGKPTFQWIEARRMDCSDPRLDPTPATVRAETWLAIAAGAHAIGYFPNDWSPEVAAEIAREKREIETLVPALTQPALQANASGSSVRVGARELNGALYVIVVNASRSPASAAVVVPALGDRTLLTLDGTDSLTASAGSFTDSLGPLEVHVYVAPPAAL